ncbi:MAG: inositol monophosphatase family protein [Microbacteriaceae bacterium]
MTPDLSPALLTSLTDIAEAAAREAAAEIMRLKAEGVGVADTKSSSVDIVTEADRLAEQMIVDAIRRERPNDGVFAEEGHAHESTTGITWVIDPIDGTVNYLYGIGAFCVSIAATVADEYAYEDGRRAVAAVVFNPTTGEMFRASEGGGATLNGQAIGVSKPETLAASLIATGFGYTSERRTMQAAALSALIAHVRDIRRIGSAAYDLCLVAKGSLDGYYEIGIQPWDWAAAALVATEAGALTRGITPQTPAGTTLFIAGAPETVERLQGKLAGHVPTQL